MTTIQEKIINELTKQLSATEHVYGLVMVGSVAEGSEDQYSDLDFWVTVKDGYERFVIDKVESVLESIGELDVNFHFLDSNDSIGRRVFHIKGTPKWNKVDVAVASLSEAYVYTKDYDPPVKVLINKNGAVKFKDFDKLEHTKRLQENIQYLKQLFNVHKPEIEKHCQRDNFLEAYLYYETYALKPFISILRAKHTPYKQDLYLKHIYKTLPKSTLEILEKLYKVRACKEIKENLIVIEKEIDKLGEG